MKNENGISQELISMGSRLADYSRKMPYSVPDDYFGNFANSVRETIDYLNQPDLVPGWSKKLPYSVPADYFQQLTGNIVGAVTVADITSLLPKNAPMNIPSGYFEALPAQLLSAAKASDNVKKEHKIIPLRRRNISNPIRWAAAAVMLMCIGLGSYETFYSRQQRTNPDKILASVSDNDIESYLQRTYRVDIEHIETSGNINNLQVDNRDIVEYLNETGWDQPE